MTDDQHILMTAPDRLHIYIMGSEYVAHSAVELLAQNKVFRIERLNSRMLGIVITNENLLKP